MPRFRLLSSANPEATARLAFKEGTELGACFLAKNPKESVRNLPPEAAVDDNEARTTDALATAVAAVVDDDDDDDEEGEEAVVAVDDDDLLFCGGRIFTYVSHSSAIPASQPASQLKRVGKKKSLL